MTIEVPTNSNADEGAAVVITHRVRSDKHTAYEEWLKEFSLLCEVAPGHLDWHTVRPIPGLTETYTALLRFDTTEHLGLWMESRERQRLIDKVRPLLASGDDFYVTSGLDFWFTPAEAKAKLPVRWKQFLVTWSAIYPLVCGVPLVVTPVLRQFGFPESVFLRALVVTGVVVYLMVYFVMPRYTKFVQRWLFS